MKLRRKLTVFEVSRECGTDEDVIDHFIEAEWIIPVEYRSNQEPALDDEDLARARLIIELQRDFEVNDEGIPIILHLLDEVYLLRKRLMESRLGNIA